MGSNPTTNAIFFYFYFFFVFSHFSSLVDFFLFMLHKILFANYDSACIIVKFKSSLRQIKPQVFL